MSRSVLPKDSMENLSAAMSSHAHQRQQDRPTPDVLSAAGRRAAEMEAARCGQPSEAEKAEVDAEIRHDNRAYDNELERQRAFERRNWRKSAMQNENGTAMHWEQYTPKNVKGMTLREEGGVEEAKDILKDVLNSDKKNKKGHSVS